MSLPSISEDTTIEQFEAYIKRTGSVVYMRDDDGELVATTRYDYGYPASPWIYDYFGECGRWDQEARKCGAWLHEPYIKRFALLSDLMFFITFVGLEYS
jgi:hypothetical protein